MDCMKRETRKEVGPGGMKCPCCAPPPGKPRAKLRKRARARLKAELRRELQAT